MVNSEFIANYLLSNNDWGYFPKKLKNYTKQNLLYSQDEAVFFFSETAFCFLNSSN